MVFNLQVITFSNIKILLELCILTQTTAYRKKRTLSGIKFAYAKIKATIITFALLIICNVMVAIMCICFYV